MAADPSPSQRSVFQPKHLYSQVRDELARRIAQEVYAPGSLLPNEFALSHELQVSIGTIRKAVELLVAEKLVIRVQGRGTTVADRDSPDFRGHFDRVRSLDGTLVNWKIRELTAHVRPVSTLETRLLSLRRNDKVLALRRLRELDGRVVMKENCRLPAARFGEAKDYRVEETTIEALAFRMGLVIAQADEWLTLVAAPAAIAVHFDLAPNAIVLRMERVVYDDGGRPLEWRIAHVQLGCLYYHAPSPFGRKLRKQVPPFSPVLSADENDPEEE